MNSFCLFDEMKTIYIFDCMASMSTQSKLANRYKHWTAEQDTGKNPDLQSKYIECSMLDEGMINYYYYVTKHAVMPKSYSLQSHLILWFWLFDNFEPSLPKTKDRFTPNRNTISIKINLHCSEFALINCYYISVLETIQKILLDLKNYSIEDLEHYRLWLLLVWVIFVRSSGSLKCDNQSSSFNLNLYHKNLLNQKPKSNFPIFDSAFGTEKCY